MARKTVDMDDKVGLTEALSNCAPERLLSECSEKDFAEEAEERGLTLVNMGGYEELFGIKVRDLYNALENLHRQEHGSGLMDMCSEEPCRTISSLAFSPNWADCPAADFGLAVDEAQRH